MKIIEIIFDNIPKIVIVSLLTYTYFFINPFIAIVMGWIILLSRVTDFVIHREKGRMKHEEED